MRLLIAGIVLLLGLSDEDRIVLYYPKGGNTRRLDKAIAEEIGSVGGVVAVVRCYVGDLCCSSLKQKSNH